MQEYIENGARLGYLINREAKHVEIYRPNKAVETFPGNFFDLAILRNKDSASVIVSPRSVRKIIKDIVLEVKTDHYRPCSFVVSQPKLKSRIVCYWKIMAYLQISSY